MLLENEKVISFVPGGKLHLLLSFAVFTFSFLGFFFAVETEGKKTLGRLIVHDRLAVEANVLPKYFNHSSFASLRRQLNYFSFVRVGKGRQRESTYINEAVIELDDILALKRRPASAGPASSGALVKEHLEADGDSSPNRAYLDSVVPVVHLRRSPKPRPKRRRMSKGSPFSSKLPVDKNLISEDDNSSEESPGQYLALDLTKPTREKTQVEDDDILAGCSALLGLSKTGWA